MHCFILNIEAVVFMVSEKIFLIYSQLCGKSIEANYLHGVPNLGPRGMVGMTYVEDHPTWLIKAVGLMVIEKKIL